MIVLLLKSSYGLEKSKVSQLWDVENLNINKWIKMDKNQNKSQIQQGKHQVLMLPVFYVWSTELWNPCRPILPGWLPWEHRESLLGCLYSILVAVLCSYTTFPVYLLCCDLHCNLEFSLKILVNNLSFRVSRPELWPYYTLLDLVCLEIMGEKLNYALFFPA